MGSLLIIVLLATSRAAAQYGVGGVASSQPALQSQANAATSTNCWAEQSTEWDIQYVETETQECSTVQSTQCSTQYREQCSPVQRQECRTVEEESCTSVPYQQCQQVPQQQCKMVHKKQPQRVSKTVSKKVCDNGGSYGSVGTGTQPRENKPRPSLKLRNNDAVNFGK